LTDWAVRRYNYQVLDVLFLPAAPARDLDRLLSMFVYRAGAI
jgi:hypothetical protein